MDKRERKKSKVDSECLLLPDSLQLIYLNISSRQVDLRYPKDKMVFFDEFPLAARKKSVNWRFSGFMRDKRQCPSLPLSTPIKFVPSFHPSFVSQMWPHPALSVCLVSLSVGPSATLYFLSFFSRVHATPPCSVGRSVGWSVGHIFKFWTF